MRSVLFVMTLGAALFFGGAWYAGLLEGMFEPAPPPIVNLNVGPKIADPATLGDSLYQAAAYPKITLPSSGASDPIVITGQMNPMNVEEVPSPTTGRILFIGEEVDEAIVQIAGSAPFLAEPYYFAKVHAGRQTFVKFYRRIYEGETVVQDQMLAMIEPGKALGLVLEKVAKITASQADRDAAIAAEREGRIRYERALKLRADRVIAEEELGTAHLTWIKLANEHVSKIQAVNLARIEKDIADIELRSHEIRALLTAKNYVVKTIVRQAGYAVKQSDPILVVQNLERMLAEALIEEQNFARLKKNLAEKNLARGPEKEVRILATIEPTLIESPTHELLGHRRDITSVAVAQDMKIVSGSEDGTVCVWKRDVRAPLRKLEHDGATVLTVACTPVGAKDNLCVVGCNDGSIRVWDLKNADASDPIKTIPNAHGKEAAITSVAFSPDGASFASGAADGSIRIWSTEDGKERYAFVPANGVKGRHEDAVTSLHFTPQCRLVSAGRDKTLRVWDLKQKGAVAEGTINFREGNVPHLGVSPDGKWMLFDTITGRTLQLLSVKDQKMVHTLSTAANSTPFDTLAIFSPDSSMIMTAGAPEGRLQLWRAPDDKSRGYEVRQFATKSRTPVSCAAFSPGAGRGGLDSFAVSASGPNLYMWSIPTRKEVDEHRIEQVPLTLVSSNIDANTRQIRIGFEVANPISARYPSGRFEAGRPVTIVID